MGIQEGTANYLECFASNFLVIAFAQLAVLLPAAPFWEGEEGFNFVFGMAPRIAVASLIAFFGRFFPERLCDEQNENRLQRKEFLVTSDRIYLSVRAPIP